MASAIVVLVAPPSAIFLNLAADLKEERKKEK